MGTSGTVFLIKAFLTLPAIPFTALLIRALKLVLLTTIRGASFLTLEDRPKIGIDIALRTRECFFAGGGPSTTKISFTDDSCFFGVCGGRLLTVLGIRPARDRSASGARADGLLIEAPLIGSALIAGADVVGLGILSTFVLDGSGEWNIFVEALGGTPGFSVSGEGGAGSIRTLGRGSGTFMLIGKVIID